MQNNTVTSHRAFLVGTAPSVLDPTVESTSPNARSARWGRKQ